MIWGSNKLKEPWFVFLQGNRSQWIRASPPPRQPDVRTVPDTEHSWVHSFNQAHEVQVSVSKHVVQNELLFAIERRSAGQTEVGARHTQLIEAYRKPMKYGKEAAGSGDSFPANEAEASMDNTVHTAHSFR